MDISIIILIIALSAMFPMMGYYLDWRARKKKHQVTKSYKKHHKD